MAATEREKQHDELRDLQQDNADRNAPHRAAEVHYDIPALNVKGDEEKIVELHAFGGTVYLDTHGEARLDRGQLLVLRQQLDAAFQAVA